MTRLVKLLFKQIEKNQNISRSLVNSVFIDLRPKFFFFETEVAEAMVTKETFVLQQYGGKRRWKLMIYS